MVKKKAKGTTELVKVLPGEVRRRRKFTPENKAAVIALIKGGTGPFEACKAIGITTETMRDWRRRAGMEGGHEFAEFVELVDQAAAQLQVFGEQTIFKAGKPKRQYPRCSKCDTMHKQVECGHCGEEVDVKCPECKTFLRTEIPGDWRAMAHWMGGQFRTKWGSHVSVDTQAELRSFMEAVSDEFHAEPQIFSRILRVAMQGAGEGVDPGRKR